jgi:hypothetical protein
MAHAAHLRLLVQEQDAVVIPLAIRIRRADQLVDGLSQRTCPLVFENEELERRFSYLAKWQARQDTYGPIARAVSLLISFGIAQRFSLDNSWHLSWTLKMRNGKIILTPK